MLKDFMYSTVYVDKDAKREEKKVDKMIEALYERLCADPTLMPNFLYAGGISPGNGPCRGGLYFRHER